MTFSQLSLSKTVNDNTCWCTDDVGCEWDYVVLTTVRSMQPSAVDVTPSLRWQRQHLGFITNEHQINVALTRARKGLIIIGLFLHFHHLLWFIQCKSTLDAVKSVTQTNVSWM